MSEASLGKSTLLMASGTLVSRILGLVRNALLVAAIGVNLVAANAFDVANKLPNILFALLASGMLNSVLVPQIVRAYRTDRSQEITDKLLTSATLLMVGLTVLLTLSAPLLVGLYIDNWTSAQTALAVTFAFWCIPQLLFYGLYTLLGQVLNAREQFGPYMWAPVVNNLISIAGFIVFIRIYGGYDPAVTDDMTSWTGAKIALLAGTATAGIVAQALVLLIPLYRSGFRWNLRFGVRGIGLRTAGQVALWTLAAGVLDQIGVLLITRIGSAAARVSGGALDVAGNSAYTNALTLYLLPHSLVTVSIATALFTRISKAAAAGDLPTVRRDLSLGLRTIGIFTVFAAALLMVLALPLVIAAIPSAGPLQSVSVSHVLVAMAPGVIALGAMVMLRWVYYAFEDGRTVFLVQVPATALLVTGAYLAQANLPVEWWVAGIGASMTVSGLLVALGRLLIIKRHVGAFDIAPVAKLYGKALVAAVVAAAGGMGVVHLFGDVRAAGWFAAFATTVVGTIVMTALYLAVLRLERTSELGPLLTPLLRRLGRVVGADRATRLTRLLVGSERSDPFDEHAATSADTMGTAERGTTGEMGVPHDRRTPSATSGLPAGHLVAGRYRLDHSRRDIPGAELWQATDTLLDTKVNVRLLTAEPAAALDAGRRAALIRDPRIPRVLAAGWSADTAYLCLEPVEAPTLTDVLAAGPIPADQARAIVGELAEALTQAARRGVHHLAITADAVHLGPGVTLTGLAVDAAVSGAAETETLAALRTDAVDLVRLLHLMLTGSAPTEPVLMTPRGVDGSPLPPDLAALLRETLGPDDDGPFTPAELARALGDWSYDGETLPQVPTTDDDDAPTRPGGVGAAGTALRSAAASAAGSWSALRERMSAATARIPRTSADDDAADVDDMAAEVAAEPEPETVDSTEPDVSVLLAEVGAEPAEPAVAPEALAPADQPVVEVEPAEPPVVPRPSAGEAPVVEGIEIRQAAGEPALADEIAALDDNATLTRRDAFDELIRDPRTALTVRRFDPTPWVIGLVLLAVLFGIWQAGKHLFAEFDPPVPVNPDASTSATTPVEPPLSTAPEPPPPAPIAPTILTGEALDPFFDNDEHPEAAPLAYDGNPETFWYSRTYRDPAMGTKPGIGYAITLTQPATVSSITVHTPSVGGNLEIRLTTAANPTEGDLLAAGPLNMTTTYTFAAPVETANLVIWITELPRSAAGNRIEVTEITFG